MKPVPPHEVAQFLNWASRISDRQVDQVEFGMKEITWKTMELFRVDIHTIRFPLKTILQRTIHEDTLFLDCGLFVVCMWLYQFDRTTYHNRAVKLPWPLPTGWHPLSKLVYTTMTADPDCVFRTGDNRIHVAIEWVFEMYPGRFWAMTPEGMQVGSLADFGQRLVRLHEKLGESPDEVGRMLDKHVEITGTNTKSSDCECLIRMKLQVKSIRTYQAAKAYTKPIEACFD